MPHVVTFTMTFDDQAQGVEAVNALEAMLESGCSAEETNRFFEAYEQARETITSHRDVPGKLALIARMANDEGLLTEHRLYHMPDGEYRWYAVDPQDGVENWDGFGGYPSIESAKRDFDFTFIDGSAANLKLLGFEEVK